MAPIMGKIKPEDFNLYPSDTDSDIYIDKSDNSKWLKKYLYDFGWGGQNGFMRLPQLDFQDLWDLLFNSKFKDDRYGAAVILEAEHAEELNKHILGIFNKQNIEVTKSMIEVFNILHLDRGMNRSEILNKPNEEVTRDWENWKNIAEKVKSILKTRGLN